MEVILAYADSEWGAGITVQRYLAGAIPSQILETASQSGLVVLSVAAGRKSARQYGSMVLMNRRNSSTMVKHCGNRVVRAQKRERSELKGMIRRELRGSGSRKRVQLVMPTTTRLIGRGLGERTSLAGNVEGPIKRIDTAFTGSLPVRFRSCVHSGRYPSSPWGGSESV